MNLNRIPFQNFEDERGSLVILESMKNTPFVPQRIYFIYNVSAEQRRGFHAHHKLQQMAFILKGECKILMDDGREKSIETLSDPKEGMLIEPMVWHEMYDFSDDCILMVLADEHYDEGDYIRDYQEFLQVVNHDS
ncbi:FdtA/QdtA family cupin domain-containing protein [Thalassotalea sp. Y01]|uniref:sugar 3,4-ketoisomerase n=1 Tax=Thalassotalea sp. Y01 TaxID=2729613 RepID=UPI00145F9AF8|nr:FdtA/QdtA family cupin domain-containing protein [Thalassotalea sp. Y01]NMP16506.1 WxcM-like domain-containing protein [Thalassotalea sp. Y01]